MTQDVLQKWPHIRTVAIIETDRANMVTNEVTHSIRYYITTLEMDSDKYPDFARDLLDISLKSGAIKVPAPHQSCSVPVKTSGSAHCCWNHFSQMTRSVLPRTGCP